MSKVEHAEISSLGRGGGTVRLQLEASLVYERRGRGVLEIKLGGSTFPNRKSRFSHRCYNFFGHIKVTELC